MNDVAADAVGIVTPKDIYQELSKRFSGLRDIQYKLPGIFSALIGGLWYFAAQEIGKDPVLATAIFVFAAAAGLACVNAMNRFRNAFNQYLDRINKFEGENAVSIRDSGVSTNRGMVLLLTLSIGLSGAGGIYSLAKPPSPISPSCPAASSPVSK